MSIYINLVENPLLFSQNNCSEGLWYILPNYPPEQFSTALILNINWKYFLHNLAIVHYIMYFIHIGPMSKKYYLLFHI